MRNKFVVGLLCCCLCSVAFAGLTDAKAPAQSDVAKAASSRTASQALTPDAEFTSISGVKEKHPARPGAKPTRADTTCATALHIDCPSQTPFVLDSNADDTNDPELSCETGDTVGTVWFWFTASAETLLINTCTEPAGAAAEPDTTMGVFSGTCAELTEIGCGEDECGVTSGFLSATAVSGLTVGQTVYVMVGRWDTNAASIGNYQLSVTEKICEFDCNANDSLENEYSPAEDTFEINGGCNNDLGLWAQIGNEWTASCFETVCGSSYLDSEGQRDTDWYRLVLPDGGPYTVTWTVEQCEFYPAWYIIRPGTGPEGICDILDEDFIAFPDPNDPYIPCGTPKSVQATGLLPGEYWLFFAPGFDQYDLGLVPQYWDYRATVTVTPCNGSPTGACCVSGTCSQMTKTDCVTAEGMYYGDGIDCGTVNCFVCTGTTFGDDLCDNDNPPWTDTTNSGCATATPLFLPIAEGDNLCGTVGTHIDVLDDNPNLRDNDWWRIYLDEAYRIELTVTTEFLAEVVVWELGCDPIAPCTDFSTIAEWTVEPDVATNLSVCVAGRMRYPEDCPTLSDPNGVPQAYGIAIRPAARGTPREFPCGIRYQIALDLDDCSIPGACCVPCAGCTDNILFENCLTLSGGDWRAWYGEGSNCGSICCPGDTATDVEPPEQCGYPGSQEDPVNGGCFANPPTFLEMQTGQTWCGITGTVAPGDGYVYRDFDYWHVQTTVGTPIAFSVFPGVRMWGLFTHIPNWPSCTGNDARWWPNFVFEPCVWTTSPEITPTTANTGIGVMCNFFDDEVYNSCVTPFEIRLEGEQAACCVGDNCVFTYERICEDELLGVWHQGDTCDPNPCCEIECDPNLTVEEGEADCGMPEDTTNGGCNYGPPRQFGTQFTQCNDTVCGTVALWEVEDGRRRDMDWYLYTHTEQGDLEFCVAAEFIPLIIAAVPGPNADPCDDYAFLAEPLVGQADCAEHCILIEDAPAGDYIFVVAPDWDNGFITCGSEYTATVKCEGGPAWCRGNSDCSGGPGQPPEIFDIPFFSKAVIKGETGWTQYHIDTFGTAPTCPFMVNDCDHSGDVGVFDIPIFKALLLGGTCDPL